MIMYIWTRGAVRPVEAGQPSPLLTFIAGEFAPSIAGVWPIPHAVFLTAPAERRHLVCIALAETSATQLPAEALLERSLKAAIRLALPEAPAGLARALGLLGETAWTAADYRALLAQLRHPRIAKVWRHAETIPLERVRAFARQPAALLDRPGPPLIVTPAAAELVSECLEGIERRDPAAAGAALARWARAGDLAALLRRVREDLSPPFPEPPVNLGPCYRRLASPADLEEASRRYRNCVADYTEESASGHSALYERGGEPGAIIELARDPVFGWRLSEARLAQNAPIEQPLRGEIIEDLRKVGVHIGRPYRQLAQALSWAHEPGFELSTPEAYLAGVFGG
jgi:hypothetical protein